MSLFSGAALRRSILQPSIPHVRHESTARRLTKRLRQHPHPAMKLSAQSPRTDHIIYSPPSSAPTPTITPNMFLPKADPRRELLASVPKPTVSVTPETLPPPVRRPYEKSYHLTEEQVAEMKRLREQNPNKWTRVALAKKYNCSTLFVGMTVQASEKRLEAVAKMAEDAKRKWGKKRTAARELRQRRRAGWGGADGL